MTNDQAKTAFIEDLKAVLKKHNADFGIQGMTHGDEYMEAEINCKNDEFNIKINLGYYFDQDSQPKD